MKGTLRHVSDPRCALRPLAVTCASFGGLLWCAGTDTPPPAWREESGLVAPISWTPAEPSFVDREALVELGRRLFFDPVASSATGTRSCADCHRPEHGFGDPERLSLDEHGPTTRHSSSLVDAGFSGSAHRDAEFASTAELVAARLTGGYGRPITSCCCDVEPVPAPDEVAAVRRAREIARADIAPEPPVLASLDALPARRPVGDDFAPARPRGGADRRLALLARSTSQALGATRRYAEALTAATGVDTPSLPTLTAALDAYCGTIRSGSSPFDRFHAGEEAAISEAARRGYELFRGRAGCASCHGVDGRRAALTDDELHVTGVVARSEAPDRGRANVTLRESDEGAFKTPTLRDVARHPPYMHDGSLATLRDVVRHYSDLPKEPRLDARLARFEASERDVDDLVAFLESLTSDRRPGLAGSAWSVRATRTRLRFVDADGGALAGWRVALVPAGDVLPGATPEGLHERVLVTDAVGVVEFTPPLTTHTRIVLAGGVPCAEGDLVPDTCRSADVAVPVRGIATVVASLPRASEAPPQIAVRYAWEGARRGSCTVAFERVATRSVEGTRVEVEYAAPSVVAEGLGAVAYVATPKGTITRRVDLPRGRRGWAYVP